MSVKEVIKMLKQNYQDDDIILPFWWDYETIKESIELSGHDLSNEKIKSLIRTTFDEIECDGWWSDIEYFMQREVE